MSKVEDFLTAEQEQNLIQAIKIAEKNTSGEIRVHIEKATELPAMERALEVFQMLKMDSTQLRNGVLFYIAVESKKFAIIGDEGINNVVPANFWDEEKELVLSHFKKGAFSKGLELAIVEVGKNLKQFFPYMSNDTNELSDEISKG
ncbi:TPM domain-containing protein [Lutibacter holmesii]|uniref:TPM domain-containing protein n=1 Tax=Lutibacter holmesii TaxID=1137985 RepID=A0ABW3WJ04_9FLAO